jgi:acyl-CoA thioesterase FadM
MQAWTETCRGTVAPWECDVTEHFTVAYYFDRLDQAAATLAQELGFDEASQAALPRRLDVRFTRELRAGDSFHVESAVIDLEPQLRLGHRFLDSASGEPVTWAEETWPATVALPPPRRAALAARLVSWPGPPVERRPEPAGDAPMLPTARGRARPGDVGASGRFSLAAFLHRFTDACIQAQAALGMTAAVMQRERRGYSTFELQLLVEGELRLGEAFLVETGVAHLGTSSMRFAHRMTNPRSGAPVARLGQFGVNLDLDARRPAAWPAEVRARATTLRVPPA